MLLKICRFAVVVILSASPVLAMDLTLTKRPLKIITQNGQEYKFSVEIANTKLKRERGLSQRKELAEMSGMLFLFDEAGEVSMWMKDTYIPLDMVFISEGVITKIAANTSPLSYEAIDSAGKIAAVLELNAGTCSKLGIQENDNIVY